MQDPTRCRRLLEDGPARRGRAHAEQILGLLITSRHDLEDGIVDALERDFDLLVPDGAGILAALTKAR